MKKSVLLGIIGVLLVVGVGITFAYFASGVEVSGEGSTVELQPGDMIKVTYDAGDSSLSSNNLIPGDTVSKTFTVTVTPTETEKTAVYAIYLDLTNNTFVKCDDSNYNSITNACIKDYEELTYTIKDGDNVLATGDLTGKTGKVKLLTETKTVDSETTFTYTLEITFHETNADQNHNMEKSLIGNVVVEFSTTANEYILASENAPTNSTTDWTNNGTGITYYYTGDSEKVNNWVSFAGFYWRIIRINGDGTIRMIYQGTSANETGTGTQIGTSAFNSLSNNNMYVGFKYGSNSSDYNTTHANINNSTILGADDSDDTTTLNGWYRANLLEYAEYIDGNAGFCGDRRVSIGTGTATSATNYQPYTRISNSSPSLSCNTNDIYTTSGSSTGNKALTQPIGLISADEAMLAGIPNLNSSGNTNNYLYTGQIYWTMSPAVYGSIAIVFFVWSHGNLNEGAGVNNAWGVRPVINIRSNVELTGTGSQNDPFVVVGAS